MNIAKLDKSSIKNSKKLIRRVLSASIDNPNNPESLNFFQADTYRFYFLMSFMWESFEGNIPIHIPEAPKGLPKPILVR